MRAMLRTYTICITNNPMNVSAISIVKSHIVFFFIVSFSVCAKKQYVVISDIGRAVRF